jgi:transcriptional regulator of nitric oxide reductase
MAYNRNIPQPNDFISKSQGQILGNFQTIDAGSTGGAGDVGFSRNHITMTDGTNGGLHYRVDYFNAVTDPAIVGFVASLYAKTVSNVELFYRNAAAIYQLTNLPVVSSGTSFGITTPWGLKLNWGRVASVTSAFATSIPFQVAFTAQPSLMLTVENAGGSADGSSASVKALSTTAFTPVCSVTHTVAFFAIGT